MLTRRALDHVLRACASITGEKLFVVIGASVVVATVDDPPPELLLTREIDLYAPNAFDVDLASDLIDGSIGSGSIFESTFGYAADGVSPHTAVMPTDWETRASSYSSPDSGGAIAIIPSIDDIALSKLVAWREKDRDWIAAAIAHGLADPARMAQLARKLPAGDIPAAEIRRRLAAIGKPSSPAL